MRKTFTPIQKAHIAIAALKGGQSISQIASENEVHPTRSQPMGEDRQGRTARLVYRQTEKRVQKLPGQN